MRKRWSAVVGVAVLAWALGSGCVAHPRERGSGLPAQPAQLHAWTQPLGFWSITGGLSQTLPLGG